MLAKLSFRNAKRQAHDYIIYFVTLTAIFSLIHGLNSLLFAEDDIFPLDDSTFILPMILISSLLFSISLWLTSYMTNFILKRRSKEISIYITLGMEPYQISKVFTHDSNFFAAIFHYFPAWIFDWLEKGSWKYHSVRLLVLRAFTARINDMSNSFAFLTSSFTVSLSLIAVVAISIFTFNYRLSLVPFTFSIITSQNQNHLADYDIYIKEK
jgi:hypothetical protein